MLPNQVMLAVYKILKNGVYCKLINRRTTFQIKLLCNFTLEYPIFTHDLTPIINHTHQIWQ